MMSRTEVSINLLTLLNREGCVTHHDERQSLQRAIDEFMGPQLNFGDIEPGSHFIAFPTAGDDSGHGGFKGKFVVFEKSRYRKGIAFNANGVESTMPDPMPVIQVVIDGVFF